MGKPMDITGDVKAGLMLHKRGKSWVVTHLATGCNVGAGSHLKRDVAAKRDALLQILPDWSPASVEELAERAGKHPREFTDAIRAAAY